MKRICKGCYEVRNKLCNYNFTVSTAATFLNPGLRSWNIDLFCVNVSLHEKGFKSKKLAEKRANELLNFFLYGRV